MKICFLKNSIELDQYFTYLAPLFERVARKAAYGEFNVEDIYRLAQQGHITIAMIENEKGVQLAIAFEFIFYPRWTAVNILALAGQGLAEAFIRFGACFKAWCREAGAEKIQASCRPAMARLLRQYGFTSSYQTMHCAL